MINDFKVAICSKGRAEIVTNAKTGKITYRAKMIGLLYDHAVQNDIHELDICYLFVEPQDVNDYVESFPKWPKSNIIVLGGNDQGISFARQTVLKHFQEKVPSEYVFTLDDDLCLLEYKWGVHPKNGNEMYLQIPRNDVLQLLDEFMSFNKRLPEWDKVGISSFDYNQFGWTNLNKFPPNGELETCTEVKKVCSNFSHADCAVMLRPLLYKKLGIIYDGQAPLKEDRDLNAQVCYHGYYSRKLFKYLMISPLNSTNKGGCSTFYKTEGYCKKSCDYLSEKWNHTYPKAELAMPQTKNTSYDRTFDVKFWWQRFYNARVKGLIQEEVITKDVFPEIINNYKSYLDYIANNAE